MLKARIDMESVRDQGRRGQSGKQRAALAVAALVVCALVWAPGGNDGLEYSPIHAELSERGSLTSCIENADVASEIEITGSSMKKAARLVSGWTPKEFSRDDGKEDYCALTLA